MLTVRDARANVQPHWHLSFDKQFADVPPMQLL